MQTEALRSQPSDPAEASSADGASWSRATLDQQLALLGKLAEHGLRMSAALAASAETSAKDRPAELALAYSRVSRAVRMSIALQSKLIADFEAFRKEAARADSLAAAAAKTPHPSRRSDAYRIVGRVICAEAEDQETVDRQCREAQERLGDPTLCDLSRPFSEIVADICRDLGLDPDWDALSEEAWARAEIRSGRPGEPLRTPSPLQGGRVGDGGDLAVSSPDSS